MRGSERKCGHIRSRCGTAVCTLLLLLMTAQAIGQRKVLSPASAANPDSGIQNVSVQNSIFREIVDEASGVRWVVLRDEDHPGGPGHLLPVKPQVELRAPGHWAEAREVIPSAAAPCVHTGDRVVVEEHTATADVHLEAVAMEPAVPGSTLRVRLKVGGKVAHAVALAPGKAELAMAKEMER